MTAPAIHHGQNAKVYANGYAIQTYLRSLTLSRSADNPEDTTIGVTGAARTREADGIEDASIEYDGVFNDGTGGIDEQLEAILNVADIVWLIWPWNESAVGSKGYGLRGVENQYDSEASHDDIVTFSGASEGSGGAERVTSLHPLAQETGDGDGSTHDYGAATTLGGAAYLQITAGNYTSAEVIVEGSATGAFAGEETTIATFTTDTAAPASERIAIAGSIPRYTRCSWNVDGSATCTFSVALHRATRS